MSGAASAASLVVRKGLTSVLKLPHHAFYIVGKRSHLTTWPFEKLVAAMGESVKAVDWKNAMELLPSPSGTLAVRFNHFKIISLSDTASRHTSPTNAHQLTKEVKALGVPKEATRATFVVIGESSSAVANVAAIARAFPLFSLKTSESALKEIVIELLFTDKKTEEVAEADVALLNSLATGVREAARLVDTPANILTTDAFVEEALMVAGETKSDSLVYKGEELKERGFGGIYNVGKAAVQPPAFVVLSHTPDDAKKTYALVGKGIVYDTGGMQIKGKTAMPSMKMDMGGAAALLYAFRTLVKAEFAHNLHLCLCIAENNISPEANKPDDIITLLSGRTVEINNTDAEGRLVLSDGVFYAKETLKADVIIDMATLTGAQAFMTGHYHAAVLTNCEKLEKAVVDAGKYSGEMVHPMVFSPDLHFPDLKSSVADMKNSNLGKMMGPPSAIAGHFIGSNINNGEGLQWAHIDMACVAFEADRSTAYGVALISSLLGNSTSSLFLRNPSFPF